MVHATEHVLGQMELKLTSSNLSGNTISSTWQLRKLFISEIYRGNEVGGFPQGGQFLTLVITLKNSQGIVKSYKGFEFRFPPHIFTSGRQSAIPQPPSTENTVIQFNRENYPNGVIELTGQLYQWDPRASQTFEGTTAFKGSAWSYPVTTTLNFETKTETEPIIEQISSILESFQILPEASAEEIMEEVMEESDHSVTGGYRTNTLKYDYEPPEEQTEEKKTWIVTKPSGIVEQYTVTESGKKKLESIGWVFSPCSMYCKIIYIPNNSVAYSGFCSCSMLENYQSNPDYRIEQVSQRETKPERDVVFKPEEPEPEVTTDHIEPPSEEQDFIPPTSEVEPPLEEEPEVTTADIDPPGAEEPEVITADIDPPGVEEPEPEEVTAQISWFGDTWFPWHLELEDRRRR